MGVWRLTDQDNSLTFCIPINSSLWFDSTINLGESIVHISGCLVMIFKKYCILLSEDLLYLNKQYRPWWNAALCIMLHFIWVFTVCKITCSRVLISGIQRVNEDFILQEVKFVMLADVSYFLLKMDKICKLI